MKKIYKPCGTKLCPKRQAVEADGGIYDGEGITFDEDTYSDEIYCTFCQPMIAWMQQNKKDDDNEDYADDDIVFCPKCGTKNSIYQMNPNDTDFGFYKCSKCGYAWMAKIPGLEDSPVLKCPKCGNIDIDYETHQFTKAGNEYVKCRYCNHKWIPHYPREDD
jgi:formate dehydrogenase maturation protein FdhE